MDRRAISSRNRSAAAAVLLIASWLLFAPPALGSDGAFEINQTCAVTAGCFPGDIAGLPVTINAPGSYLLTGNLTVPDGLTTAIEIAGPNVVINLGGFRINRLGCSTSPSSCLIAPPVNPGHGIARTTNSVRNVTVSNGSITGMGGRGILLADESHVGDMRVRWNGGGGVEVGKNSVLNLVISSNNGGAGVVAGNDSSVTQSIVSFNSNQGGGINMGDTSIVSRTVSYDNSGPGIVGGVHLTVIESVSAENSQGGIHASHRARVVHNMVRRNPSGFQLSVGDGSVAEGNAFRTGGETSQLGVGSVYRNNYFSQGPFITGGFNGGGNLCGSSPCP